MIQKVASQRHGTQPDQGRRALTPTEITEQLSREFPGLDRETVWRWVRDTLACVRHLHVGAEPHVIERLAREHLTAIVNSPIHATPSTTAIVGPDRVDRPAARRPADPFSKVGAVAPRGTEPRREAAGAAAHHGPIRSARW